MDDYLQVGISPEDLSFLSDHGNEIEASDWNDDISSLELVQEIEAEEGRRNKGVEEVEGKQFSVQEEETHNIEVTEEDLEANREESAAGSSSEDSSRKGLEELDKEDFQVVTSINNSTCGFPEFKFNTNITKDIINRPLTRNGFYKKNDNINRYLVGRVVVHKNVQMRKQSLAFSGKITKMSRLLNRSRRTSQTLDEKNKGLENTVMELWKEDSEKNGLIKTGKKILLKRDNQLKVALREKLNLKRILEEKEEIIEKMKTENGNKLAINGEVDSEDFQVQFTESPTGYMVFPKDKNEFLFIENLEKVSKGLVGTFPKKYYLHKKEGAGNFVFGVFESKTELIKNENCSLCNKILWYNSFKPFSPPIIIGANTNFPNINLGRICRQHITGKTLKDDGIKISVINVVRRSNFDFFKS